MKSKFNLSILFALMLVLGLVAGSALAATPQIEKPKYKVNTSGQTFGNVNPQLDPSIQEFPQLIAAIGIDGTEGYIYASDLNGNQPKTPEEAISYMKALEQEIKNAKDSGKEFLWYIPLYKEDGKTVIGQFGITP